LVFILGTFVLLSLRWCSRWRNPSALLDLKTPCLQLSPRRRPGSDLTAPDASCPGLRRGT